LEIKYNEEEKMRNYQQFIAGEFVASSSRKMINVINPATEGIIAEVPDGTAEDVRKSISAAYEAQKDWEKLAPIERAGYLRKIAAGIRENADAIARLIAEEQGKILALTTVEANFAADYLDYMAEWARRYEGEIIPSDRRNENILVYKRPIGVTAGILPWNFPFFLIVRKLAPALLTGNSMVIKPSSLTPCCAFEFAKIVAATDLPKGLVSVITGRGSVVGKELATDPRIGMVSVTGSVEAGSKIMSYAAQNITKVSLELGGKAPAIVMDDAELDLAVKSIKDSRVINTGQVCNCVERVYVHEKIADQFIKGITKAMEEVQYGDPVLDSNIEMGPLVSKDALDSIDAKVQRAVSEGAKITTGGKKSTKFAKGYYYEPTVLINCTQEMEIMRQEIFGPVLPIMKVKDLDEAIALANDCEYGLTSSIYTQNIDVAMRAANELQFGETYINRENFEAMQGFHAGWKKSGIGGADGRHGLEEYLQTHVVYLQYNQGKK
jgi:lactaldehyde dehydrogenase/glycolaldehyde dehydrogenase